MGRNCSICIHPDVEDINRHLMYGTAKVAEIARMYAVSPYALKRHKLNHLKPIIEAAAEKVRAQAEADAISTIEAVEDVIRQKGPDLLQDGTLTFSQYLDYIKFRSTILGEQVGPANITIEWGPTLQEDGSAISEPEGLSDNDVEEIERFARAA